MGDMVLSSFSGVVLSMLMVPVGCVSVMRCLFVVACFVVFCSFFVVVRCVGVVFRRFVVMLCCFL